MLPKSSSLTAFSVQPPDLASRLIVWGTWLAMTLVLFAGMAYWSSPIPLAEDWLLVAPLTGHEPNLAAWVWAQNNEHRSPLSRLLLLALLQASHGDFSVSGYFNIVVLSAATALTIIASSKLRGRIDVADIFFPLTLLHLGHSVQFLFGWQLTFVLPVVILIAIECVLFGPRSITSRSGAFVVGSGLVLLPLCGGGNGLLYVPTLGALLLYFGWRCRAQHCEASQQRSLALWHFSSAILTLLVSAIYFIGYQKPTWNPPSPGIVPSAKTALKVLALGFGPIVEKAWVPFIMLALGLTIATACCALRACARDQGFARERAIGATVFLLTAMTAACAVGWVRAGYVPEFGIPTRYALLVTPAFCACFFAWESFASSAAVQRILAAVMLVLLPFNTWAGHTMFAAWYTDGMKALHLDLGKGIPLEEIATKHRSFLIHWWEPGRLAQQMQWLRDAGITPFNQPQERGVR